MKKAFTIIELIFVILIIAILATVSIPKLLATRDDATAVRVARNVSVAVEDIIRFYIANNNFSSISNMTNVAIDTQGNIQGGNVSCVQILPRLALSSDVDLSRNIDLNEPILVVNRLNQNNTLCKTIHIAISDILNASPIKVGSQAVTFGF